MEGLHVELWGSACGDASGDGLSLRLGIESVTGANDVFDSVILCRETGIAGDFRVAFLRIRCR